MSHVIKFNGETIITPVQWDESYSTIETEMQTEAGTTKTIVVRNGILSVSASWQVSSYWYKKLMNFAQAGSITLNTFDPISGTYTDKTVRIRDVSSSFLRFSEKINGTDGLWTFNCNIKEY